jgi:AraC-like DNA-binding protein
VVDIGLLDAGTMHIRHDHDQTLVLNAGTGPVLFDPTRAMTANSSHTEFTLLRLPRAAVVAALGGAVVPRRAAVRPLAPGTLTTGLVACLRTLRREAQSGVPTSVAALDTAGALALVSLAHARGERHHWPGELNAALYRAACHELALRADDPMVTVNMVAHVLGCSRAQLCRLFAAHGETVAGYLHEVRMRQAAFLLRAQPQLAIGVIALQCSYIEPAAFTKAFRRRFGSTPRGWRAAVAGSIAA